MLNKLKLSLTVSVFCGALAHAGSHAPAATVTDLNDHLAKVLVDSGANLAAGQGRTVQFFRDDGASVWTCSLMVTLPENSSAYPTVAFSQNTDASTEYMSFDSIEVTRTAEKLEIIGGSSREPVYGIPMGSDKSILDVNLDANGKVQSAMLKDKGLFKTKTTSCAFNKMYQSY